MLTVGRRPEGQLGYEALKKGIEGDINRFDQKEIKWDVNGFSWGVDGDVRQPESNFGKKKRSKEIDNRKKKYYSTPTQSPPKGKRRKKMKETVKGLIQSRGLGCLRNKRDKMHFCIVIQSWSRVSLAAEQLR